MARWIVMCAAALLVAAPATAHESHDHASPQHGGRIVTSGPYDLEVVTLDGVIEVHVTGEDEKPVDATGTTGSATILSGGMTTRVELAAAGGNLLKGTGAFVAKGAVIVLMFNMPGKDPHQVRLKLD